MPNSVFSMPKATSTRAGPVASEHSIGWIWEIRDSPDYSRVCSSAFRRRASCAKYPSLSQNRLKAELRTPLYPFMNNPG
jgi:hypothetical protein